LITKGEYFDGEKEGEWFYELNDHQEKGKYRYGERNGYWEHRFPEGKVSFEGSYVDGAPQGKHKYYSEDGYLIKEENYSFGQKDGK
jgi:antitoxin component YwqK of YwqJK toxin-antitoxin module